MERDSEAPESLFCILKGILEQLSTENCVA